VVRLAEAERQTEHDAPVRLANDGIGDFIDGVVQLH
jgi:hypothetical protein